MMDAIDRAIVGTTPRVDLEALIQGQLAVAFAAELERTFGVLLGRPDPDHAHEWEQAYDLGRLTGNEPGDARVYRCLPCGEIREYGA